MGVGVGGAKRKPSMGECGDLLELHNENMCMISHSAVSYDSALFHSV